MRDVVLAIALALAVLGIPAVGLVLFHEEPEPCEEDCEDWNTSVWP